MKRSLPWVYLSLCLVINCVAAGERKQTGARASSLGGASVTCTDLWSIRNNQAGMAWIKTPEAGLSFENRFMMSGLSGQHLCALFPFQFVTAGISLSAFGNQSYRELEAGLAFSRKFGPKFSAGLLINYIRIRTLSEYGTANLASFDIGLLFRPKNTLTFGIHISNPYPVRMVRDPAEILVQSVNIGAHWKFSESFSLFTGTEKSGSNPLSLLVGLEYQAGKNFHTRIGISAQPYTFSFGAGLLIKHFTVDFASGYHPVLGFSPVCSILFTFMKQP